MKTWNKPIEIDGIHLDAHSGRIKVSVDIGGKWVEILNERQVSDGHISHIVEPDGIRLCITEGRPR